ncbi:MAG: nucleotide exchange factor GrpE [Kiritimatiellae bacterium]|nr:nucleotide exchange factor GrpE [Kiritimatiellia bacterium]
MNEEEQKKSAEEVASNPVGPETESVSETETEQEQVEEAKPDQEAEPTQDAVPDSGSEEPMAEEKPVAEEVSAAAEEPSAPAEPDWKDQYARLLADFDNYRKRVARDKEELAQFAAKDILKDLLPTVDNLALALDKAENKEDPFVQGVKLAYDGFLKALADHGATPLDSIGEPFDANFHEAIAQLPSPDVAEGIVMNEVKRGWLLHGKLLRAAQVVVSSGAPEKPAEA